MKTLSRSPVRQSEEREEPNRTLAPPRPGLTHVASAAAIMATSSIEVAAAVASRRAPSEAGSVESSTKLQVQHSPAGLGSLTPVPAGSVSFLGSGAGSSSLVPDTDSPALSTRGTAADGLGNSIFYDDVDSVSAFTASNSQTPDPAMTQKAIDQVQSKIDRTKELIREEQTLRDGNVDEYLKLSSNADKQQQQRIKQVFEKKNSKSAVSIAHYQKKLEDYQRRMQDLQENGLKPKQRDKLGQGLKNVRDGISEKASNVMSKPKEFVQQHLLRHHKFGSADNLSAISKDSDSDQQQPQQKVSSRPGGRGPHGGSASLPRENSGGGLSTDRHSSFGSHHTSAASRSKRKCISDDGRRSGSLATSNSESEKGAINDPLRGDVVEDDSRGMQQFRQQHLQTNNPGDGGGGGGATGSPQRDPSTTAEWRAVIQELTLHKEEVAQLREEMDDMRQRFKQEVDELTDQLREERDRHERLEEQMNDLTELHQHEVENIKSGVNDMEEKVQYQSEERLRDLKEHLQILETKITSIEHQQVQQQYLNIDALDSANARVVLMRLLSMVIGLVHVLLLFLGTTINLLKPFLQSPPRALGTFSVVVAFFAVYHQQEHIFAYVKTLKEPGRST